METATNFNQKMHHLDMEVMEEIKQLIKGTGKKSIKFAHPKDGYDDWCDLLTIDYEDSFTDRVEKLAVVEVTVNKFGTLDVTLVDPDYLDERVVGNCDIDTDDLIMIHSEICGKLGVKMIYEP